MTDRCIHQADEAPRFELRTSATRVVHALHAVLRRDVVVAPIPDTPSVAHHVPSLSTTTTG